MKFKYLIILIAVASLVILYLLSLITSPAQIPLSALHTYDGQQVVVEGIVTDYRTTSYGNQLITIRGIDNTNYSVTLYIEGDVPVDYGDTLQVTGEVQQYKGQWEILVNNPHFVILLKKWDNHSTPLWHLAENPEAYLGLPLNITGIVIQKHTASCSLTDMTGTYTIDVSYDSFHFLAGRGLRVIALDISLVALRLAIQWGRAYACPLEAAVLALANLWLPPERFDVILNFHFLERGCIPEFQKALKPGGIIYFETFLRLDADLESPERYLDPG